MGYCVYKHTTPSGKVYIGITGQNPLDRWLGGLGYKDNQYFMRAIMKYGWNNIRHEILYADLSKEEACAKEMELIKECKSNDRDFGYNHSCGGEYPALGSRHTEAFKNKMRELMRGRVVTEETRKRMSQSAKGRNNREGLFGKDCGHAKRILQINEHGDIVAVFYGVGEIARALNIASPSKIGEVCRGIRKKAYGYRWQYAEDE